MLELNDIFSIYKLASFAAFVVKSNFCALLENVGELKASTRVFSAPEKLPSNQGKEVSKTRKD